MKRIGVFVFYNINGEVNKSTELYLNSLKPFFTRLIIVVNGKISDAGKACLEKISDEIAVRENIGYDVGGYKFGIEFIGYDALIEYDELVLFNDSVYGPIYPFDDLFEEMENSRNLDFWGISGCRRLSYPSCNPIGYMAAHIQSYFTAYKRRVFNSPCFKKYWDEMPSIENKNHAIERHEVYVTYYFAENGFKWGCFLPIFEDDDLPYEMVHLMPMKAISEYKCPIVKRNLFSPKRFEGVASCRELYAFIKNKTGYPSELIYEDAISNISVDELWTCIDNSSAYISSKRRIDELNTNVVNISTKLTESQRETIDLSTKLIKSQHETNKLHEKLTESMENSNQLREEIENCSVRLNNCQQKCEQLEGELNASQREKAQLTEALALSQQQYTVISNAFCWKMTKPIRFILDLLKYLLRDCHILHLIWKGLKCLKQNGIRYTFAKVKHKLSISNTIDHVIPETFYERIEEDILFSILIPTYNTDEKFLREAIDSVCAQTYSKWELCIADGSDKEHSYVEKLCTEYCSHDIRIHYHKLEKNLGISENTNCCAELISEESDYIVLFDHDDLMAPQALAKNAWAIHETDAEVLYSDEDHCTTKNDHHNPFYKPNWSPDLLYSQMYICHLLVFKTSLFREIGGFRKDFDGSQDYDLMLRLSEKTDKICHIPEILYSWRESATSTASNASAKPYAHLAGLHALDEHLKRKYGQEAYAEEGENLFTFNPRFPMNDVLISIIIPFKDKHEMTEQCVESILEKSNYQNYEIILENNRSEDKETLEWIENIQKKDERIRVINADIDFNWSALNNIGIKNALGEVFIFLNNDTIIDSSDWLERLGENALRKDIGVVGAMLLYPDNSIQHAGVVVGMFGAAEHIFKGELPIHYGSPYVSPVLSRNALAVTGACMAVSRRTVEKIGLFDDSFIICGSDVEFCIRAYENGLINRYDASVKLYHLESKSRSSYIPPIDFIQSEKAYRPYWDNGDPYFNGNLNLNSFAPRAKGEGMDTQAIKQCLMSSPQFMKLYRRIKKDSSLTGYEVMEARGFIPCRDERLTEGLRLNLVVPSVNKQHVFGGIATALQFFEALRKQAKCKVRIILVDADYDKKASVLSDDYVYCATGDDCDGDAIVMDYAQRSTKELPVNGGDVFVTTAWWTAYAIADVMRWQKETFGQSHPQVYLIQDFEPGFYPWSSRYLMAESTYRSELDIFAVINSTELQTFLNNKGYTFAKQWAFLPKVNDGLRELLPAAGETIEKKKQIIIYGRPTTERNAFALAVEALKEWSSQQKDANKWTILSAGEQHADIALYNGAIIHSVGKLSLSDYAKTMRQTYAGISLMVSPHPSYPPLEMASFGINTITNTFDNKDISSFSDKIISLKNCSAHSIARALGCLCNEYSGQVVISQNKAYCKEEDQFENIAKDIVESIQND